jgi:protein-tyrosine phosphatase
VPAVVRRSFLLAEAAEIAARIAADGWPETVAPTPAARLAALPVLAAPYRQFATHSDNEVPDPYRLPPAAYVESLATIEAAVDRLTGAIGVTTGDGKADPATVLTGLPFG